MGHMDRSARHVPRGWDLCAQAVDRFVEERLDALPGLLGRALADNPDGRAVIGRALHEAMLIGYGAGPSARELHPIASQERWQRFMDEWGVVADPGVGFVVPDAQRAEAVLEEAGRELDLTGAGGGWRSARQLRDAGRAAAVAGALLAKELTRAPETSDEPAPGGVGPLETPQDMVKVIMAPNRPMAELIRSRLLAEGIPSSWRTDGADVYFGDSQFWEIYVPRSEAGRARRLLEVAAGRHLDAPIPRPTRRPVLPEHQGVRLAGKVGVLFVAFVGAVTATVLELPGALRVVALVVIALALVLTVVRSEQRGVGR
jgi:hypothetical protein